MWTFTDKMVRNDLSQVWTDLDGLDAAGYSLAWPPIPIREFFAELRPGDRVNYTEVIESISPEKKTGPVAGHFVTTLKTYRNGDDQVVGTRGGGRCGSNLRNLLRPKLSTASASGFPQRGQRFLVRSSQGAPSGDPALHVLQDAASSHRPDVR